MDSTTRGASPAGAVSGFAASPGQDRDGGFGSLRRRRRRLGMVALAVLLAALLLAFAVPALLGGRGPTSSGGDSPQGFGHGAREEDGRGAESGDSGGGAESGQEGRGADGPQGAVADSGARVPDVSGDSVGQAREAINGAGLTLGSTRSVASREEPEGTVTGTEPPAGSPVEEETPITLLVSGGPDGPPQPGASAGASASASASTSASTSAASSAPAGATARPR